MITRKATGFKSLRVICWEIDQVTSKCKIDKFLDENRKDLKQKGLKQKSEHYHPIFFRSKKKKNEHHH